VKKGLANLLAVNTSQRCFVLTTAAPDQL